MVPPPGRGVPAAGRRPVQRRPVPRPARPPHHAGRLTPIPPDVFHKLAHSAPLESRWVPAGFLLAFVASAVALFVRRRGRGSAGGGRRRLRRVLAGSWLTLLLLLSAAAALNSYVGYVPTVPALFGLLPAGVPGAQLFSIGRVAGGDARYPAGARSRVVVLSIGDPAARIPPRSAYVYLPPGYDAPGNAHRRYAVVYLIHGYPSSAVDWFRGAETPLIMDTMLADRLIQPMIVVAPDVNGGWEHDSECLNAVGGPQVATYLTRDVVGQVDRQFRTVRSREARAIGGMSSGGYCALNLALRHLDEFSVVLAEEPYGDPGTNVLRPLLGGSEARFRANSPSFYLPRMRFTHPVACFMDVGSAGAGDVRRVRALAALVAARGQLVEFRIEPHEGHTWHEARVGLPFAFAFASQQLQVAPAPPSSTVRT